MIKDRKFSLCWLFLQKMNKYQKRKKLPNIVLYTAPQFFYASDPFAY